MAAPRALPMRSLSLVTVESPSVLTGRTEIFSNMQATQDGHHDESGVLLSTRIYSVHFLKSGVADLSDRGTEQITMCWPYGCNNKLIYRGFRIQSLSLRFAGSFITASKRWTPTWTTQRCQPQLDSQCPIFWKFWLRARMQSSWTLCTAYQFPVHVTRLPLVPQETRRWGSWSKSSGWCSKDLYTKLLYADRRFVKIHGAIFYCQERNHRRVSINVGREDLLPRDEVDQCFQSRYYLWIRLPKF